MTTAMLEDAASHAVSTLIISAGADLSINRPHSELPIHFVRGQGPAVEDFAHLRWRWRVLSEFTMGPTFLYHRLTMLPSSRAWKWSPTFRGWWSPTPRR